MPSTESKSNKHPSDYDIKLLLFQLFHPEMRFLSFPKDNVVKGQSLWVGLNFRGRVFGSDFGGPIWDEVLAAMPPTKPLCLGKWWNQTNCNQKPMYIYIYMYWRCLVFRCWTLKLCEEYDSKYHSNFSFSWNFPQSLVLIGSGPPQKNALPWRSLVEPWKRRRSLASQDGPQKVDEEGNSPYFREI